MPFSQFITALKGSQSQFRRFARIVENAVVFYLLIAAVWSLCWVIGHAFNIMGVS